MQYKKLAKIEKRKATTKKKVSIEKVIRFINHTPTFKQDNRVGIGTVM